MKDRGNEREALEPVIDKRVYACVVRVSYRVAKTDGMVRVSLGRS